MEALLAVVFGLAGVAAFATWRTVRADVHRRPRDQAVQALIATFGPAQVAVQHDPSQLLVWQPLADAARRLFPDGCAALDEATGQQFPFSRDVIDRAHARWTTEWLAWEMEHDEEYRLKAAAAEQELRQASGDAVGLAKARLDRVQHEKVQRYQKRYEGYIRTAKALQALLQ